MLTGRGGAAAPPRARVRGGPPDWAGGPGRSSESRWAVMVVAAARMRLAAASMVAAGRAREVGGRDIRQRQGTRAATTAGGRGAGTGRTGEEQQRQGKHDRDDRGGCCEPFEHWAAPCVSFRGNAPAAIRIRCAAHATDSSHQRKEGRNCQ